MLHPISSVVLYFVQDVLYLIPLQSLICFIIYPSVSCCFPCIYILFSAVILLMSVALMVPYNKAERATVLHNFILVFFRICYGLNTLLTVPIIFK